MIATHFPTAPEGALASGEPFLLVKPWRFTQSTRKRVIVCVHGHGVAGSTIGALTYMPGTSGNGSPSNHALALVQAGYALLSIDAAGPTPWGDPAEVQRIHDAFTYAMGALGSTSTKVALMAWSMGGLASLNAIAAHPGDFNGAWLWQPAVDLQWVGGKAGYAPAYSLAYAGSTYNAGAGSDAPPAAWGTEVGTDYGASTYPAASDPMQNVAAFRGLPFPVKITNAGDDNTLPPAAAASFVAAVNDPQVTLRAPQPIGSHTAVFAEVPPAETVAFFDSLNWAA